MIAPNDIEVLLHYNSSPDPHSRIDAPAVRMAIGRMVREGLMIAVDPKSSSTGSSFELTDLGRSIVTNLCETHEVQRRFVRRLGGSSDRIQAGQLRDIVNHMVDLGWATDSVAVHAPPGAPEVTPSSTWIEAILKCIDTVSKG